MTNHNGLFYPEFKMIAEPGLNNINQNTAIDSGVFSHFQTPLFSGTKSPQDRVETWDTHDGLFPDFMHDDRLFERIYFFPREIDAGFITEDVAHTILIWNAYYSKEVQITDIQKIAVEGTLLIHPATPITIPKEHNEEHTLNILKDGPPFQQTTYIYTIDGQQFTLTITGRRIEPFLFEPDWSAAVKVSFNFLTALTKSKGYTEQRRPMFETPKRELTAQFWFDAIDLQKSHIELRRYHDKILGVPIFTEPLTAVTSPLQGETVVEIGEEIDERWNLHKLTEFILIKDLDDRENHEVKAISSMSTATREITFETAIIESYSRPVLYPLFIGIVTDFKPMYETDDIAKFSLKFEELKLS